MPVEVNKHCLFVYGTLKQGYPNSHMLAHADFLGDFEVNCCKMYAGSFAPYLVCDTFANTESRASRVKGELYLVSDKHLTQLDRLEGHPTLYERMQLCWFNLTPEKQVCVLSYIFKGATKGFPQITEWTKKPSYDLLRL